MANSVSASLLKIANRAGEAMLDSDQSLISRTQPARLEPFVLVDSGLINLDIIPDVLHNMTNLFSAYYLQAVAMENVVGNVQIMKVLKSLNGDGNASNRDALKFGSALAGMESYQYCLPKLNPSLESSGGAKYGAPKGGTTTSDKSIESVNDLSNLAVGKMIKVTLTANEHKAEIPVTIRLNPVSITPKVFTTMFSVHGNQNTAAARWHRFKAGELGWKEMLTCVDMVDQYKEALVEDGSGMLKAAVETKRKNKIMGVLFDNPTYAAASNIAIISAATALQAEIEFHGDLNNLSVRDRMMGPTGLMFLVVVDPEWETVTIYHRGLKVPTKKRFRDIKSMAKNGGPDIMSVLQDYLGSTNQVPTF